MAAESRFPEIERYNARKKELEDFDAAQAAKADAIRLLAQMLNRGGWGAVEFESDFGDASPAQRIESGITPISAYALGGESVLQIVTKWRSLMKAWEAAYEEMPDQLRSLVPRPSAARAKPQQNPRHAQGTASPHRLGPPRKGQGR
jgi:hypothetical protein